MELNVYTIDGRGQPSRLLLLIHGFSANEFHLAAYGGRRAPRAHPHPRRRRSVVGHRS